MKITNTMKEKNQEKVIEQLLIETDNLITEDNGTPRQLRTHEKLEKQAKKKKVLEIQHVLSEEKSSKQQFEDNTEEIAQKIKQ